MAAAAGCAPASDVEVVIPSGARSALLVRTGHLEQVLEARVVPLSHRLQSHVLTGEKVHLAWFDRPLADFGVPVEGDALVLTSSRDPVDSAPLPDPIAWQTYRDGEVTARAVPDFATTFEALRVTRQPCPTLRPQRMEDRRATIGRAVFAAALGGRHVVLGLEEEERSWAGVLIDDELVLLDGISSETRRVVGFGLPDETVWLMLLREGPDPRYELCQLTPDAPLAPRCEPVAFADPAQQRHFRPLRMLGRQTPDGLELLVMSYRSQSGFEVPIESLWHRPPGGALAQVVTPSIARSRCDIGIETDAWWWEGDRGVVGFAAGPILAFEIEDHRTVHVEPLFDPQETGAYCRSLYGRHPAGPELIGVQDGQDEVDPFDVYWRATPAKPWVQLDPDGGINPRIALPLLGQLLVSSGRSEARFVDYDPRRPDLGLRLCREFSVGHSAHHAVLLDDRVVFTGESSISLLSWSLLE